MLKKLAAVPKYSPLRSGGHKFIEHFSPQKKALALVEALWTVNSNEDLYLWGQKVSQLSDVQAFLGIITTYVKIKKDQGNPVFIIENTDLNKTFTKILPYIFDSIVAVSNKGTYSLREALYYEVFLKLNQRNSLEEAFRPALFTFIVKFFKLPFREIKELSTKTNLYLT
jgi:hypothetical protein